MTALQEAEILTASDLSVRDLQAETAFIGNASLAQKRQIKLTDEILVQRANGLTAAPAVVLQAALAINIGPGENIIVRPDALIAPAGQLMYYPGEIKSYAYLKHLTDSKDVAQAASQVGVYGMALERRLQKLGVTVPVPTVGIIVMAKPNSMNAIARKQDVTRDVATARRIIDIRPRTLDEVERAIGRGRSLDTASSIMKLQPSYCSTCRSICPLHDICRAEAQAKGNPAVLGSDVEAMLIAAGCSLPRGLELLNGAKTRSEDEALLQERLQFAEKHWRAA